MPVKAAKELSAGLVRLGQQSLTRQDKELAKPVGYSGQLPLDGEFDSPPSPPETQRACQKAIKIVK